MLFVVKLAENGINKIRSITFKESDEGLSEMLKSLFSTEKLFIFTFEQNDCLTFSVTKFVSCCIHLKVLLVDSLKSGAYRFISSRNWLGKSQVSTRGISHESFPKSFPSSFNR